MGPASNLGIHEQSFRRCLPFPRPSHRGWYAPGVEYTAGTSPLHQMSEGKTPSQKKLLSAVAVDRNVQLYVGLTYRLVLQL